MRMEKLGVTSKMIRAAETLFLAMTVEQTIRPVVEAYEKEIMVRLQMRTDPKWAKYGIDRLVLERKDTFLLSKEDSERFIAETFKARDAAKLKVDHPEACPLLVAINHVVKAENALIETMGEHPQLGALKNVLVLSLDKRKQAIEMTLRLLAPFVRNSEDMLFECVATPS